MVDEEIENTLREIRDRVRETSEREKASRSAVVSTGADSVIASRAESATRMPETMARIGANLTTTERAWDRLPPLVSQRSGAIARVELWVKQRLKQATRWYSWEQINFNAAVHNALRDTLDALLHHQQQLAQLSAEFEARAEQLKQDVAQRAAMEAEQRARSLEVTARLTDLARELRERDGQRLEEQRVCFKQLSLEMSEAEVLLDRARRHIDSRLDKLESSNRES